MLRASFSRFSFCWLPAVQRPKHRIRRCSASFPPDYTESRARFRIGCQRLAVSAQDFCRSWRVASQVDPDLTIDEAFFTGGGTRLLVLQSGNHGAEFHSGAAVQAMVMERYLRPLLERGIDVYFIHALDPYGFKYNRRTDEFNVNLNRNFSLDGSIYRTSNPGYARYRRLFEPASPVPERGPSFTRW